MPEKTHETPLILTGKEASSIYLNLLRTDLENFFRILCTKKSDAFNFDSKDGAYKIVTAISDAITKEVFGGHSADQMKGGEENATEQHFYANIAVNDEPKKLEVKYFVGQDNIPYFDSVKFNEPHGDFS
jgi:hypothetical protein